MSIFINIYICNACQYWYFCRKFAEMHKGKRELKRHLEFTSSTDNKLCKNIFNVNYVIFNNLSDILNYLPTVTWTFHGQTFGKGSAVLRNHKMSISDQVHLQKFWHTWRTWKILKKIWIQIYQFWNLYCNTIESFLRPKIFKIFTFWMDELLQIATKENLRQENFRQHQNFIFFQ